MLLSRRTCGLLLAQLIAGGGLPLVAGAQPVAAARASANAPAPLTPATEGLARFTAWWAGEWNNNEQVWQQKLDAADAKLTIKPPAVPHLHHIVMPLDAPQVAGQWFYLQQSQGADLAAAQRARLVRLTLDGAGPDIRQDDFKLPEGPAWTDAHLRPVALAAQAAQAAQAEQAGAAGVKLWRFDVATQSYSGGGSGQLTAGQWIFDGPPGAATTTAMVTTTATTTVNIPALRSRKVRYYEGWVWFKVAGPGAAADDTQTSFTARVVLHNEGQRIVVKLADGSASPYLLELALLTYQNTRRPILKFALLDSQTQKTLTYIWGSPDAPTLGMNLQWFQAGVTAKSARPNFGF